MAVGGLCVGLGAQWATAALDRRWRDRGALLRPPGSVDELRFAGLCVRCGNCIRACPYEILEPDLGAGGIAGLLAPVVRFGDEYCREDCHQCTHVCPSGAIRSLPLEKKPTAPIGLAVLDSSICLLADDRECDICARMCPYEAIEIVWCQEEYIALPRVDPDRCPGCGACQVACPGTNEWERQHADEPIPLRKAIEVHPGRR
jgi:ferredoxin-type protein NapF